MDEDKWTQDFNIIICILLVVTLDKTEILGYMWSISLAIHRHTGVYVHGYRGYAGTGDGSRYTDLIKV